MQGPILQNDGIRKSDKQQNCNRDMPTEQKKQNTKIHANPKTD